MASTFNDHIKGVALGHLVAGQDITQRDYAEMLADEHGAFARMGVRHNMYTYPNFFRTTSGSYTTTNDTVLGADLHETTPFFTMHRQWNDSAGVDRVALTLFCFGRRFAFRTELFAVDTGASLGSLFINIPDGSHSWAATTLILNAADAYEGGVPTNPPRGIVLESLIRSNLAEAEFGNAFLHEYWLNAADV